MTVKFFRKRPVIVQAIRWDGDNEREIQDWAGGPGIFNTLTPEERAACDDPDATAEVFDRIHSTWVLVLPGQWIVEGVKGEHYPVADDVLEETYDPVTAPTE